MKEKITWYIKLSLIAFLLAMLTSCDLRDDIFGKADDKDTSRTFYAANFVTEYYYTVKADLVYDGTYCKVYKEVNDTNFTTDQARAFGEEFDANIYTQIVKAFGEPSDEDNDTKITILLLDIQDGFSGSGGYVAGYFDPNNLLDRAGSNRCDMIYIDTYPGSMDIATLNNVLAHEFQHLINFNQKYFVQNVGEFDTWINEGMSSAAEEIYAGTVNQDRIDYYNSDPYSDIAMGQRFIAWGNTSYSSVLGNYATVYLFFHWLKEQAGNGFEINKSIMAELSPSSAAVLAAVNVHISSLSGADFGEVINSWHYANIINSSTTLYGYKGTVGTLTNHYINDVSGYSSEMNYSLLPGECIYVEITSDFSQSYTAPITAAGLTTAGAIDTTSPFSGDYLAVMNINGDPSGAVVSTGTLPDIVSSTLKVKTAKGSLTKNYPVDVVFGLNGKKSVSIKSVSKTNGLLIDKKSNR